MTTIKIITPTGAFGSSAGKEFVTTCMRVIGVGFGEEGDWCAKYGVDADTDVFTMRRFYWGDCDCGADEREEAWSLKHFHKPGCYYVALQNEKKSAGLSYIDTAKNKFITIESKRTYERDRGTENEIYGRLLAKYRLPKTGCAVHCTCGHDDEYKKWATVNGHTPTCSLELPNFLYKSTGFALEWYKYIGRDMKITVEASLPSDFMERIFSSHPRAMTLEQAVAETARQEEETAECFAAMFKSLNINQSK